MAKLGLAAATAALAAILFLGVSTLRGADTPRAGGAEGPPTAASDAQTGNGSKDQAPRGSFEPATADEKKAAVEGLNAFAAGIYAKLKAGEQGNLFFSPYSISTALSMTYAGARGNTAAEMEQTLQLRLKGERLHAACGALIADLNADQGPDGEPRGFKLAVANRLFGAKQYTFLPEFLAINEKLYGAPLERMDFAGATEASRKAINAWVEQQTNDRIKDLIQARQLDATSRLVLVNAIYFKSDWLVAFEKKNTREEPFQLEKGGQAKASMMNDTADLRYYEEEGKFQAVELPYKGRELSMLVFLPARVDALGAFEDALTGANLKKWSDGMAQEKVVLSLPKFKLTWGTKNIVDQLKDLGMRDAFERPKADFSGMDGTHELYISMVLHKAFVEVNEKGTEAAAATGNSFGARAGGSRVRQPHKVFKADRPFLFLIRETASGAILFMGRVANPAVAE